MNRKRTGIPVTSMYSNVLPNPQQAPLPEFGLSFSAFTSRAPSSTESDPTSSSISNQQTIWPIEPGFPGILDTIWGTGFMGRLQHSNQWTGRSELVSDVSLASSSDLGSSIHVRQDHHTSPMLSGGFGNYQVSWDLCCASHIKLLHFTEYGEWVKVWIHFIAWLCCHGPHTLYRCARCGCTANLRRAKFAPNSCEGVSRIIQVYSTIEGASHRNTDNI